jgi:hypothetical protein
MKATATTNSTETAQTTETTAITKADRFASDEYIDPNARLPRIQALRGEKGDDYCGYFITEAEMERAGWYEYKPKDLITYQYNSGSEERGLLFQAPRMIVVQRSPLFAFDRQSSMAEKRLIAVGPYDRNVHSDRSVFGTATYYEVLLLSDDNQPLHEQPLGYLAKGANQATFSKGWQSLIAEVTRCHAKANNIPVRSRNKVFSTLCVYNFATSRELAGEGLKSYACKVGHHIIPTMDNWESLFLGRVDEVADQLLAIMNPQQPAMELAAIAPSGESIDATLLD